MITETTFADQTASEHRPSVAAQASVFQELGSIEFRVVRTGLPARRMRLNTTRCTLGSGEGCTVRLHDSSLRPMHAVILRDASRILLRAYTVPIEVNGRLTGETFLRVGDQFTLGSYCFELVDAPEPVLEPVQVKQHGFSAPSASFELPLRVEATPLSFTDHDVAEVVDAKKPNESPKRNRLSFVGGAAYVSEALQAFASSSLDATRRDDATTRSSFRADADHLRSEVDAWRKREQRWKEQDQERRAELEEAISRFHESQDQAAEAGRAVAEMRVRMEQLSQELTNLKTDAIENRQDAAQRQTRLREAADAASAARLEALRQRDDANREYEEAVNDREQLRRDRDQLVASQKQADANRNEAIAERDAARGERDRLALVKEEFGQHLNRARIAQSEMTEKIRKLNVELDVATEQLRAARTELAASYAKVEALSIEAEQARRQLQTREQSQLQQTQTYEVSLQSLRSEIGLLEANLVTARSQAASASADRHLAESLQSSLASTDASRVSDRLSWEQEAAALQENIRQLSLELAAATGRMTQAELNREATKSELNEAQGRLATTQRELTMRPTPEQWDQLQGQLTHTEQELDKTAEKFALLLRDYDELLTRQSSETAAVAAPTTPNLPTPSLSDMALLSVQETVSENEQVTITESASAIGTVSAALPEQHPIDDVSSIASNDYDWPTYQSNSDVSPSYNATPGAFEVESMVTPASEPWPSNEAEIADRLQSYTAHDESHRLAHCVEKTPAIEEAPVASSPLEQISSDDALVESSHPNSPPTPDAEQATNDSDLGSLAKRLIAQLSEESVTDASDDNSPTNGQSLTSSSIWDRLPDQATTGEFVDENDTPSVWNYSSQFRTANEFEKTDNENDVINDVNDDEEIDEEVEVDYLLREQVLPQDRHRGSATEEPAGRHEEDDESIDQTFMLPMSPRESNLSVGPNLPGLDDTDREDSEPEFPSSNRVFDFHATLETPLRSEESEVEPQSSVAVSEEPTAAAPSDDAVDDDSIEAYMNRLLKRVQGQSGTAGETAGAKPAVVPAPQQSAKTVSSAVEKPAETPAPATPVEVIDPNTPLVPRSQAPEHAANLAAMREIANASADTAISQSVRGQAQQLKSKAVMDLFQAGVVFACAVAFYACGIKITSLRYVWFTAAALAASLAFFFLIDMMKKLATAKATYDRASSQASNDFIEHS